MQGSLLTHIEGFNMLVNKRIDYLQKEIIKLDNMLIKDK